jgi:signal peptidase I
MRQTALLNKTKIIKLSALFIAGALFFTVIGVYTNGKRIGFNITESFPERIFVYTPYNGQELQYGQRIVFKLPVSVPKEYGFHKGSLFSKEIVGREGDEISFKERNVTVELYSNGKFLARAYKKDALGNTLPIFRFTGKIPKDCYFVVAPHPYSFDSRYFGFIKKEQIEGIVVGTYF